jgi:hypothetical protein
MTNTESEKTATMLPQGDWVRSFYLEELKNVRAEADRHSDDTRVTERYVLGACGAIYTFLFAQLDKPPSGLGRFIWWLPCFLMIWGASRSWALYMHNRQCCSYLKDAEEKSQIANWGWEHWKSSEKKHSLRNTAVVVWGIGVVATSVIAFKASHLWPYDYVAALFHTT